MRALVIAHGEPPSAGLLRELAAGAGLVVAADGGALVALDAGVMPDWVVGDLDTMDQFPAAPIPRERFVRDADPETTDLEKAIRFALARGAAGVDVAAAGGGRGDHALANLSVLVLFAEHDVVLHDDLFAVWLVRGRTEVAGEPGTVVSLIAPGGCRGVTTRGLRWELRDDDLPFSPRGVHNELVGARAEVEVREGALLVFRGRWVERHR
ncbi:thiamine diphosphokinase [Tepidiforma flava]|uniref:Thiamine diphosphokinase n=1 Tax=Tepidiforma flava TaxID=3004094 RepID=A0ABY7M334_9CHLR|nr:thiamine diphosphokinase [Tepidiforma flava]WBL35047.1 thiamine diphosphokinase [Tepidiforma flava]